jgi:hypothetical protein
VREARRIVRAQLRDCDSQEMLRSVGFLKRLHRLTRGGDRERVFRKWTRSECRPQHGAVLARHFALLLLLLRRLQLRQEPRQ